MVDGSDIENIRGCMVAEMLKTRTGRSLHIGGVIVEPGRRWGGLILAAAKKTASVNGCDRITGISRRGVDRLWREFEPVATVYEMKV